MAGSRYVCIDVEPGGKWRPDGSIGLCEVDANGDIGTPFFLTFTSPLGPGRPETDFPEVWALVDAFLGGSIVAAYNARYDRAALRRLAAAVPDAIIAAPEIRCVLEAVRRTPTIPSIGCLGDAVIRLQLFSEAEVEVRRRRFFDDHYGNKWMLNDSSDDALACARLVAMLTTLTAQPVEELLHPVAPRLR